jgi:small-conductance mechanosensitive channel
VIAAALTILTILAGLAALFVLMRREQITKKQREWIADLTQRLDYVEPKMKDLLTENKTLRTLMNPTAQMERNHTEIMKVLTHQGETLTAIQAQVEKRPRSDTR